MLFDRWPDDMPVADTVDNIVVPTLPVESIVKTSTTVIPSWIIVIVFGAMPVMDMGIDIGIVVEALIEELICLGKILGVGVGVGE